MLLYVMINAMILNHYIKMAESMEVFMPADKQETIPPKLLVHGNWTRRTISISGEVTTHA